MISAGGMAQLDEWSRFNNQGQSFPRAEADVLFSEGRCSSISHRCEWKNGPDDSVCIMILFMQIDIR
jgi:hypothetical protein